MLMQLKEGGLASLFLMLVSAAACLALVVILSFGLFGGISMFDAIRVGLAGPVAGLAALIFVLFALCAYCAGTMAIFRHSADGYRADFVRSLGYGWKASLPVTGALFVLYIGLSLFFLLIMFGVAALIGTSGTDFFALLDSENLGVGLMIILLILYIGLLVIVSLFIPARFGLAGPIMAAHGRLNPFWAMGRSWALTKGHSLKLMGYLFLVGLAWTVTYLIVSFVSVTLVQSGFYYAAYVTTFPFTLAYVILYALIFSGIYYQLSGGVTLDEEQIDDVFG